MISEREVDEMIKYPKTQVEKVAVPYFIMMTCPLDITPKEEAEEIMVSAIEAFQEELSVLVDEIGREKAFTKTKNLAVEMALATNMPFYKENRDWMELALGVKPKITH
tara:strand:+ start:656 stop:979 length:324 start_codon:yes stop_codon:yes gene_type:complete